MFHIKIQKNLGALAIIEGINRPFRKVTKIKSTFSSDKYLLKILYLAS